MEFESIGYFKEYWQDGKMLGTVHCEKPEDNVMGYHSIKHLTAEQDIKLKKKTIKAGQKFYTRVYPLNGKIIK